MELIASTRCAQVSRLRRARVATRAADRAHRIGCHYAASSVLLAPEDTGLAFRAFDLARKLYARAERILRGER